MRSPEQNIEQLSEMFHINLEDRDRTLFYLRNNDDLPFVVSQNFEVYFSIQSHEHAKKISGLKDDQVVFEGYLKNNLTIWSSGIHQKDLLVGLAIEHRFKKFFPSLLDANINKFPSDLIQKT